MADHLFFFFEMRTELINILDALDWGDNIRESGRRGLIPVTVTLVQEGVRNFFRPRGWGPKLDHWLGWWSRVLDSRGRNLVLKNRGQWSRSRLQVEGRGRKLDSWSGKSRPQGSRRSCCRFTVTWHATLRILSRCLVRVRSLISTFQCGRRRQMPTSR